MIVTELNGGLGNQMFQYAIGRNLAIKNQTELRLDISTFDEYKLRKVKESGYVTIRNQGYYLSEAFGGKTIAVKESNKGQHLINLYFRQFRIGQIDIEKRVFTFKKAYLIENDPRFAEAKHKK